MTSWTIASPGSSVHRILQARILEWVAISFKPRQCIKNQGYNFANKCPYSQSYGFSNSHVWMWELDHKEDWAPKNWCFWIVVLEKTLESPLDKKEIKQSILKEISPEYYSFEGLMLKLQYFGPLMQSQLIGKDPDAGKDWRQEEKGTKEDEMVGWHHQLNEHDLSKLWDMIKDREAWRAVVHRVTESRTPLSDWTELKWKGVWKDAQHY